MISTGRFSALMVKEDSDPLSFASLRVLKLKLRPPVALRMRRDVRAPDYTLGRICDRTRHLLFRPDHRNNASPVLNNLDAVLYIFRVRSLAERHACAY
jgi:hypothetical protein